MMVGRYRGFAEGAAGRSVCARRCSLARTMRIAGGQRGQSLIEYAILVGVVVTALSTVQTYVRRSLQGRLHDAAMLHCDDPIGSQFPCNSPPTVRALLRQLKRDLLG